MSDKPIPPIRAREIFLAALELETTIDRTTYIDRACGHDRELSQAVKGMLKETDQLDGFLEKPAAVEAEIWRERKASEQIGPYKLLQEIGEGGCGVVYMAEQLHPVRRRVALKLIKLGMDTKNVIARFESERQALAMMDHPNIAKVLDAGASESGRPYFIMELVRGVPITDYCDQHRLSTEDRLHLFMRVTQAIQHAHQKGIIHRDIKPSNILVTMHDGVPVPKIIDFGIAKAVDQRLTEKTLFTEFQSFIGTPAYMSPEQAEMSGLDIDTRSDIYALGVLLYELLVGSTPFDAKTLREASLEECRRTIREVEPAKPSLRLATLVDADRNTIALKRHTESTALMHRMKGDLDWIVMTCLDKDRQRRYATANALAMDIQRYLDGELVSARPPSALYRLQKLWCRNRLALSSAAAVIIALVSGIGMTTWQAIRATSAEQDAHASRVFAERDREQAIQSAARARLNEYVADMNVANLSLREGNFGRAWQLVEKHHPQPGQTDLRGFEWRYLANESQGDEHLDYPRHHSAITALTFSLDGNLLAVGMEDEVKVWNVRTLSEVMVLPQGAYALHFMPNGRALLSTDRESVTVWNTTSWLEQLNLPVRAAHLTLNADGSLLAMAERSSRRRQRQGSVQVWDTSSWEMQTALPIDASAIAFSPKEGNNLAIWSHQGIEIWDARRGDLAGSLENSTAPLGRSPWLTYSPDGKAIVAPQNDQTHLLSIWDTRSRRELGLIPADPLQIHHQSTISSACWTPDGKKLITGSWDHSIQLWDVARAAHLGSLRGHRNEVWTMAIDPSGETVASGGKDGELLLWPVNASEKRNSIIGNWKPLAFDQAGTRLAAIDNKQQLAFFDPKSLTITETINLDTPALAISDDLETLILGQADHAIEIREPSSQSSRRLALDGTRISSLTVSPNGRHLAVMSHRDAKVVWWDLENASEPVSSIDGSEALFSQDGSTLATLPARGQQVSQIWDVTRKTLRQEITLDIDRGSAVSLSHDGKLLAIVTGPNDANHAIRLWDLEAGTLLGSCRGHKQGIWATAFSPDGKSLASTSDDGTLKLWNVQTQQELLSIPRPDSTISSLVFSPDGQWLATGSSPFGRTGELSLIRAPHQD